MTSLPHPRVGAARFRRTPLLFLLGLCLAGFGFGAEAAKKDFSVPADDAAKTLKQFAAQSGEQLLFSLSDVAGVKTIAVEGSLTPRDALEKMLAGTPLVVAQDKATGALAVRKETAAEAKNVASRRADRAAAKAVGVEIDDGKVKLGVFEVFGSKLINLDVARSRDDVQPYVVFDKQQIASSQASNLTEFFRTRLPMNATVGAAAYGGGTNLGNNINLRGLGANQTLILVDGRRLPGYSVGGSQITQSDINGIPLSLVERIEILPSTASGIYGGGATGGVVNIITRKDFTGAVLTLSYGNTFSTDNAQSKVELLSTTSLRGGATVITLTANYGVANDIRTGDRSFAQRARNLAFANNPALFTATANPPRGYTTNIRSQNGANLVLKPQYGGTVLSSAFTSVPVGYAGIASDNAAALVANAGHYNLDLPNDGTSLKSRLVANATPLDSLGLSVRQKVAPWLEGYVDFLQMQNRSQTGTTLGGGTTTLGINAPDNPFTTPVNVSYPLPDLPLRSFTQTVTTRITGGLVAKLPGKWQAGLDYNWGKSRFFSHAANPLLGDPDGSGPGISYATALSTGVLDVVRDLNVRPFDYTPYLMPNNVYDNAGPTHTQSATVRGSGPVYHLPAGDVIVSTSVAWLRDVANSTVSTSAATATPTYTYQWFPEVSSTNRSAYAEVRVPLLGPASGSQQTRLEMQLSARYDGVRLKAYSGFPPNIPSPDGPFPAFAFNTRDLHDTTWTAGLRYAPISDLTLRASTGTGFLPPGLNQIVSGFNIPNSSLTVIDPKRGNVSVTYSPVTLTALGNPNLRPELSKSASVGAVFTPRFLPDFRLSVDYTKITKTDEITPLTAQQVFNFEDVLPGQVTRAALTPADQALGYTGGAVTGYSIASVNFARRVLEALDFQADYTRKTSFGEFHAYAIATLNLRYASQIVPGAPMLDQIGFVDGAATGWMRWRGNAGVDWSRGAWSAGWNAYYFHSLSLYNVSDSPAARAATLLTQGSDHFPSQLYHELRVSYQFGRGETGWRRAFNDLRVGVGLQNVFNQEPPVRAGTALNGGFQWTEDPRLRRYSLNVQKRF